MSDLGKITLGGKEFDIPELPLGVQRRLEPITRRMSERAIEARKEGTPEAMQRAMSSPENIDDAELSIAIALAFIDLDFTPKKFDHLIEKAQDELFMMKTDIGEIIAASVTVAIRAGGKRLGEKVEAALKAAQQPPAPEAENPPTTTQSSPTSA